MERFLLNTEDYQRHYMCNYSVDKVPLASRQKIALSTVLFIVGFIEIVLPFSSKNKNFLYNNAI